VQATALVTGQVDHHRDGLVDRGDLAGSPHELVDPKRLDLVEPLEPGDPALRSRLNRAS
jgi:hypothetical protein